MQYVMPFILAMVVTMTWLPVLGRVATKWSIVDKPGIRKVHTTPIPRIGGVAMAIGVLVAAIVGIPVQMQDQCFLLGAAVIVIFGVLDDRFDLDYRWKLLGQLLAAGIVVIAGDIQIHSITLEERWLLTPWVSYPLSLFFLVGITNAINLADGLDGLAGGTTFLCLSALAMLAYASGQNGCVALSLAFAGAVLGFLRFNTFPASVFMGDAGSQLLGFAVGVLSLRATQNSDSAVSAAAPVLLLGLPILDTLSVMAQRISEGRSPFSPDRNHIHHKLLRLGFDHHEAVTVIYLIQADLLVLAYWMRYESDLTILGVVTIFFAVTVLAFQWAERRRWRFRSQQPISRETPLSRLIGRLREPQNLPFWSYLTVAAAVAVYGCLIVVETTSLASDVRLLVIALLAVTVILLAIRRGGSLSIVEKAALYVTTAVLVYLDNVVLAPHRSLGELNWVFVLIAAAGTMLNVRLSSDRRFVMTPLDLIVLFVALVVPSLPGSASTPDWGVAGIAKLVILFYAVEVMISRAELWTVWVRLGAALLLAGLTVRPLLSG